MRGKELMPHEVEAPLKLGVAPDLKGIVVIFSRVTGGFVKVVESRQKANGQVRVLT